LISDFFVNVEVGGKLDALVLFCQGVLIELEHANHGFALNLGVEVNDDVQLVLHCADTLAIQLMQTWDLISLQVNVF
jgi:hypothetical protein